MILDLLKTRRSIRAFKDEKIEDEKIDILKKVALLSPTSKNKQPWAFVFVEDKETLKALSTVKPKGGHMIKDSALTIVILADPEISDVWIEDASIATAYLHLASHDLGLGSCWVQIRNRMKDYDKNIASETLIQEILDLPENKKVLAMLAVGYPDEAKDSYETKDLDFAKIHLEKY